MKNRELKLVAEAKQKEFDRLKDLVLNQISLIEVGLNINSVGRDPYGLRIIWPPTSNEIFKLNESLTELRNNALTVEEKEILND